MWSGMEIEELHVESSSIEPDYERVIRLLTDALNELGGESDTYRHQGENIGWRNLSGDEETEFVDGEDLLRTVTPDSPWSADIEFIDDAIRINLSHHDSPMGETHVITQS